MTMPLLLGKGALSNDYNDLMPGQAHFLGWEKSESFDKAEQMLEDYLLFGRLVS